jgi:o-succinylbenzoate synthase
MIECYQFDIPFKTPFYTSKTLVTNRCGILLKWTFEDRSFWSEISPLPGFSDTTLDSCINWLRVNKVDLDQYLGRQTERFDVFEKRSDVVKQQVLGDINLNNVSTPAEIAFAADTLLFQYGLSKTKQSLQTNLKLTVNATSSNLASIQQLVGQGYKTVKLKVGGVWSQELTLIRELRYQFPELTIRLDANESWDINTAFANISDVASMRIEYIEQPVNQTDLLRFGRELNSLGTKIAADESARNHDSVMDLLNKGSVQVVIIKPPMIGSFKSIYTLCESVLSAGCQFVFTSSLDAGISRNMAAFLAHIWGNSETAHGFSTGNLLLRDIISIPDEIINGQLTVPIEFLSKTDTYIDRSNLNKML